MSPHCTIVPARAADWPAYRDLRLASLSDAPDAFGSTFAAERTYSDAHWRERLAHAATSGIDLPMLAMVGGVPAGLAWAKADPHQAEAVNLFQMWVAPAMRGHGIGNALVEMAIGWARGRGAHMLQLGVALGQAAALRTYVKAGFVPVGAPEPLREGSALLSQPMRLFLNGPARPQQP